LFEMKMTERLIRVINKSDEPFESKLLHIYRVS